MVGGGLEISYKHDMSSAIPLSSKAAKSAPVIESIGELLAAAARLLDADAIRRLGGPGLGRRLVSILAAFLTFSIVARVRQRASAAVHRVSDTADEARRYLTHPPAGWAAP